MYKLLKINGIPMIDPEGSFVLDNTDKYNEYDTEDGTKTIEVIREDIVSLSVSYKGLTAEQVKAYTSVMNLVSNVEIYDPTKESTRAFSAKITGIKTSKVWHRNDVSVWSLSFRIDEL